jgi:hypothetical protein
MFAEVIYADQIDEGLIEMVKPDILWLLYSVVDATQVEYFKIKFNLKVVLDIDDTWQIPVNHPNYLMVIKAAFQSKRLSLIADLIIVSTLPLKQEIESFTFKPIVLIENNLRFDGQFEIKPKVRGRKTRIGFLGSTSHLNDWLSIQNDVNKVLQIDSKNQLEFYIIGVAPETKRNGKVVVDNIRRKLKLAYPKAKFIPFKDVHSYMDTYNEIDILLVPLEENELNKKKSHLKLLEASCKGVYCILDPHYESHPLSRLHTICRGNWYQTIKEVLGKVWDPAELQSEVQKYQLGLERKQIAENLKRTRITFEHIYTIYYSDDQLIQFVPYKNLVKTVEEKSYLFEYNVITKLVDNTQGLTGFLSHKFLLKTGISAAEIYWFVKNNEFDVLILCRPIPKYLEFTEGHHPGFTVRFKKLLSLLDIPFKEPKHVVYSNFFIAKSEIYKEYNQVLTKAIDILENEMYEDAWGDSSYKGLPKEKLIEATGLEYYTFHTFLLERLFSVWLETKDFNVKLFGYEK